MKRSDVNIPGLFAFPRVTKAILIALSVCNAALSLGMFYSWRYRAEMTLKMPHIDFDRPCNASIEELVFTAA